MVAHRLQCWCMIPRRFGESCVTRVKSIFSSGRLSQVGASSVVALKSNVLELWFIVIRWLCSSCCWKKFPLFESCSFAIANKDEESPDVLTSTWEYRVSNVSTRRRVHAAKRPRKENHCLNLLLAVSLLLAQAECSGISGWFDNNDDMMHGEQLRAKLLCVSGEQLVKSKTFVCVWMPEAWQTAVKSRLLPGPLGPLQRHC
jgi:hypothetical protein